MNENNSNDLQTIITQVIEEMKSEQGDKFDPNKINLAEMGRRTGLTRAQLRRIKSKRIPCCSTRPYWEKSSFYNYLWIYGSHR